MHLISRIMSKGIYHSLLNSFFLNIFKTECLSFIKKIKFNMKTIFSAQSLLLTNSQII